MAKITISIPDEMNQDIENSLEWGDVKSAWMRQAIRYRFIIDHHLPEEMDEDERLQAVEEALQAYTDLNS